MQLRDARLCLDCEELHNEERCPVCASDAFAFVTRWVPSFERKPRPRRAPASPSRGLRWMTGGATGLALLATARWLSRPSSESVPQRDEKVHGEIRSQAEDQGGEDQRPQTGAKR
jgi:hypothetical protein